MLRIISLNLNGIRSAWSKNLLPWLCQQEASIVCLQELKAQLPDLSPEMLSPDGLRALAETGVDRISIRGLTKDVKATDFSMRMQELS